MHDGSGGRKLGTYTASAWVYGPKASIGGRCSAETVGTLVEPAQPLAVAQQTSRGAGMLSCNAPSRNATADASSPSHLRDELSLEEAHSVEEVWRVPEMHLW